MSNLIVGILCAATVTVFALLLMRMLMGEWIWETHNHERNDK